MYQQHPVRLSYQPPASSTFPSEQTSYQQSVSSTFLSEQTSTSHHPPAIQLTDQLCLEAFGRPQTTGRGREPGPAAQTAPCLEPGPVGPRTAAKVSSFPYSVTHPTTFKQEKQNNCIFRFSKCCQVFTGTMFTSFSE
jgi:hypothetical protein